MEINSNDYPVKKKTQKNPTISFHLYSPLIGREVIPELRMNGYCLKSEVDKPWYWGLLRYLNYKDSYQT